MSSYNDIKRKFCGDKIKPIELLKKFKLVKLIVDLFLIWCVSKVNILRLLHSAADCKPKYNHQLKA